jgi:colicin import membrane protein
MYIICIIIAFFLHVAVFVGGQHIGGSTLKVRTDVPVYNIDLVNLAPAQTKKGSGKATTQESSAGPAARNILAQNTNPTKEPKAQKKVPLKSQNATTPKQPKAPPVQKKKQQAPKKVAAKPTPKPTPEQIMKDAFDQAKKDSDYLDHLDRKKVKNLVASLRSEVEQADADATAEAGQGGTGGIYAPGAAERYGWFVENAVKGNWRFPVLPTKTVLTARVEIGIAPDGKITGYTMLRYSGRGDFDDSVQRAVEDTDTLRPPPPGLKRITIDFSNEE